VKKHAENIKMKLKYEMTVMEIDGSNMAIPVGCTDFRGVIHMNETTADILTVLKNDVTEDQIVSELLKIYDASDEQIRQSVKKVIAVLDENNLLCD